MSITIRCYFLLYGFSVDPDEVTRMANVQPARVRRIGDRVTSVRQATYNEWCLNSRLPGGDGIEDHIQDVLKQMSAVSPEFIDLCAIHTPGIGCAVYIEGDRIPALHVNRISVAQAARLHCYIDIDLYHWPES